MLRFLQTYQLSRGVWSGGVHEGERGAPGILVETKLLSDGVEEIRMWSDPAGQYATQAEMLKAQPDPDAIITFTASKWTLRQGDLTQSGEVRPYLPAANKCSKATH